MPPSSSSNLADDDLENLWSEIACGYWSGAAAGGEVFPQDHSDDDDDADHVSEAGLDDIDVALAALVDDMAGDSHATGAVVPLDYDVSSKPADLGDFGTEDEDLESQSALPGKSKLTDEQRRLEILKTPLKPSIGWYSKQIPKPAQNRKKPDKKVKEGKPAKKPNAKTTVAVEKKRGGQLRKAEYTYVSPHGDTLHNSQSRAHKKAKKLCLDNDDDEETTKSACRLAYSSATKLWHGKYNPHLTS